MFYFFIKRLKELLFLRFKWTSFDLIVRQIERDSNPIHYNYPTLLAGKYINYVNRADPKFIDNICMLEYCGSRFP
jgi:hypothetical protein